MPAPVKVAILGTGNIGTDLLLKLMRQNALDVALFAGVDPASSGIARARELGVPTSTDGVDAILADDEVRVVFDATSAYAHREAAPKLAAAGKLAVDLTPAAVGPPVVPAVNLDEHLGAENVNLITCGGQATIPMVYAVSRVTAVPYAEIVASVSSRSAGPGTRANIDEFTETTSQAVAEVGGADRGKAIIILNPVVPPMIMRDTVFCAISPDADHGAITASVHEMIAEVQQYVPGYTLRADPQFDDPRPGWSGHARVAIFLEVKGRGDYLPPYAGNLDIMTAAAARVGELMAAAKLVAA
jgi:acetaldehyde dehydrogenase